MDRNEFLLLAMSHAMGNDARVIYDGIEYYPISYTITPQEDKTYLHSVKLQDIKQPNSFVQAKLNEVVKQQGENT